MIHSLLLVVLVSTPLRFLKRSVLISYTQRASQTYDFPSASTPSEKPLKGGFRDLPVLSDIEFLKGR